jgi:hypothetical protein
MTELRIATPEHPELQELAAKAKKEVGLFGSLVRSALQHARQAGEFLLAARTIIQTEKALALDYRKWVPVAVGISDRHADNYIKIHQHWDSTIKPALEKEPELTLSGALALLKGPPRQRRQPAGKTDAQTPAQPPQPQNLPPIGKETGSWEEYLESLDVAVVQAKMDAYGIQGDVKNLLLLVKELLKDAAAKGKEPTLDAPKYQPEKLP